MVDSFNVGSGIGKYVAYVIRGKDRDGEFEIQRRYKEFDLLHEKLILRWPGVYIPAIPNKTTIGNTEKQVTLNRMRFLNGFLNRLAIIPGIYYAEEVQAFLKSDSEQVEKSLQSFEKRTVDETLNKYIDTFAEEIKEMNERLEQAEIYDFFGSLDKLR